MPLSAPFQPLPVDVTQEKTNAAFIKNLPAFDQAIIDSIRRQAQGEYDILKIMTPQAIKLMVDTYKTFGPEMATMQARQLADAQRAQVGADLEAVTSPEGKALSKQALDLAKMADPEFYDVRGTAAEKFNEALKASSAGVSPTERAELQRSIARSDPRTQGSALNTVENAMQFGDLATKKANNLALVTSQVSRSLPSIRTGLDLFGVASGRGAPNIQSPNIPGGSASPAENLFAGTSATAARGDNIRADRPSTLSTIGQGLGLINSLQNIFRSPDQGTSPGYSYGPANVGGNPGGIFQYGNPASFNTLPLSWGGIDASNPFDPSKWGVNYSGGFYP